MSSDSPEIATELRRWLDSALAAVDPELLVYERLQSSPLQPQYIVAIGKAAAAMCRGARAALGELPGICVANTPAPVPPAIDLLIGEHPVPGDGSFAAGHRLLEYVETESGPGLALISGGGSALCEWPREGVDRCYIEEVDRRLLTSGEPIERANLARGHLSALKSGGLARAAAGAIDTLVLSDVSGCGPGVVASGPTIPGSADPETAREILLDLGMEVPPAVWEAMSGPEREAQPGQIQVIGDGMTAARVVVAEAEASGHEARVRTDWLSGDVTAAVEGILTSAGSGVTVAAGETSIIVSEQGRGGRNTHAALLAAEQLDGSEGVFAAFATDGVDGSSDAAGAIVDGRTIDRGGDPSSSLQHFDSATYLERTGSLIHTGPTGTNVADIWVVWHP